LTVIIYAFYRFIPTVGQITKEKGAIDNHFPSYEQVIKLRHIARQLRQPTGKLSFTGFKDRLTIEGLTFAHPDNPATLIDINVSISQGTMVAFVGQSGAGKSTLIDLIMGFHEPQEGCIKIDDRQLGEFNIDSYRRRLGYVSQENILFNLSIKDNLLWANDKASEEDLRKACKLANAHQFIKEFPEGYNTVVGDRGVRLSGGQIQRISLARSILRNPDILILDEATSSLDTQSERLIQAAIEKIAKKTTVIVIAHRLSTIKNADFIYGLADGRIIEEGGYSELIERGGQFNRMAQLQRLDSNN